MNTHIIFKSSSLHFIRSNTNFRREGRFSSFRSSLQLDLKFSLILPRCGSVIADLVLNFSSTVRESEVLFILHDAAKSGRFGDFNVSAITGTRDTAITTTMATTPTSSSDSKQTFLYSFFCAGLKKRNRGFQFYICRGGRVALNSCPAHVSNFDLNHSLMLTLDLLQWQKSFFDYILRTMKVRYRHSSNFLALFFQRVS